MPWFPKRRRMERELAEEIAQHLEEKTAALEAEGMSRTEARRAARVAFGNPVLVRERSRVVWQWPRLQALWGDLRFALRRLAQAPGFSATAVLTVALGIGAPTALFAVLDAVLLRPLPFAEPDRLVAIRPVPDGGASIPTIEDWQGRSHSFASLAAYRQWTPEQVSVRGVRAERILGVTQNFFATLGVRFAQGHGWAVTGDRGVCTRQAVVSGQFWRRLGGGALGSVALQLDGRAFPITGVLPDEQSVEGLAGLNGPDTFLQLGCDPQAKPQERGDAGFEVLGRLRPGVSLASARADLEQVDRQVRAEHPRDYGALDGFRRPPAMLPYAEWLIGEDTKTTLDAALGACGLLLAIACANLANLLLARAVRRREELALRVTLGATLRGLLWQMLIENSLLVAFGAAGGLLLALVILGLLRAAPTLRLPRLQHASLDLPVVLFAVVAAAAVAALITVLPARRLLRPELVHDFGGGGRSSSTGSLKRAGRVLVVAQLSLTLVLLASAGWLMAGVWVLLHQPLGFDPERLLMVHVQFTEYHQRGDAANAERRIESVAQTLRALPGITAVAATDHQPLGHSVNRYDFASDAHPGQWDHAVTLNPNSFAVSPGYFAAIGQTLREGRDFDDADDGRNPVAIVNQSLAAREWPGQSPVGHRIRSGELQATNSGWATVVGVAADVHNSALDAAPEPDLYIPRFQDPSGYAIFAVRTVGSPEQMARTVEAVLRKRYPEAASRYAETMDEMMAREVAQRRFLMQASAAFAAAALFLAVLGTYGLLAYEVSLREKEIGIRLALGSPRGAIVHLLLRQEGRWLALGGLLGLVCAALAGWALRARFYDAPGTALPVLAISAVLLLAPALLAVALPARRASLLDPAQMMRRE